MEQNLTLSAGKAVTLATIGRHRVDGDAITLRATSARGSRPSCSGGRGCGWTASDRSCRRHTDSCREDTSCMEDKEDIDICLTVCSCVHPIYGITLFNCVLSIRDHTIQLCTVDMGSHYSIVYCQCRIALFNCVLSIWDHTIQLSVYCK